MAETKGTKKSLKRVRIDELSNKHYHSNEQYGGTVLYNSDETTSYIEELESKLSMMEQTLNKYKSLKNIFPMLDSNSKGLPFMQDAKRPKAYMDPLLDFEFQLIRKREKAMALHMFTLEEKVHALSAFDTNTPAGGLTNTRSDGLINELERLQKERKSSNITNLELKGKVSSLTTALSTSRNTVRELETANDRFVSQIFLLQQQITANQSANMQSTANESKT